MPKQSAGLLLHRGRGDTLQVLLVHPGGPLWAKKDEGAWTIPKGEFGQDEEALAAAIRELREETGFTVDGPFRELGSVRQAGGKTVYAFACGADLDATAVRSNTFPLEWPPRSGRIQEFPEIDRAAWFSLEAAEGKINMAQRYFLARLREDLPP